MKTIGFWHICMINDYMAIITDQLKIILNSGLYNKVDSIQVGCVGQCTSQVEGLFKNYPKIQIKTHEKDLCKYEFPTLKLIHQASQGNKFFGFYIHTKGVSYPGNEGGIFWRDYMNYYNITQWRECVKKLNKGYNLCGVKLLNEKDIPARQLHYSGNFFWFKSSYTKLLPDPYKLNIKDRFQCEFWIGKGERPVPASLCQYFVDYNTKGRFNPEPKAEGKNYVHTLCWNLTTEVEKVMELLYSQNYKSDFEHYLIDLGFPLENNEIPKNIKDAIQRNSTRLKCIAQRYGSSVMKLPNVGVSQNWTAVFQKLKLQDDDVLIGADPDEHTINYGWINAMGKVLRNKEYKIGMVSLMMTDHTIIMGKDKYIEKRIEGERVWFPKCHLNWALIGFSGEFLNLIKEIPYPKDCPRYGYIESMLMPYFDKYKYNWVILPDYKVRHTDYELGEPGSSQLLREWKNTIIFQRDKYGQIDFIEFLKLKQKGKI